MTTHKHRSPASLGTAAKAAVVLLLSLLALPGCSAPVAVQNNSNAGTGGISIVTHDRSNFVFQEDVWSLTARGISGIADIITPEGATLRKDTTLPYTEVASATPSGGRGTSMRQFLLTILGVVLVIGLAALILYAAFPATDR